MNLKDAEPLEASLNHCDTRRADLKVTLGLFDAPAILTRAAGLGVETLLGRSQRCPKFENPPPQPGRGIVTDCSEVSGKRAMEHWTARHYPD